MKRNANSSCKVNGCERPTRAHGWCSMHYQRLVRLGHIGPPSELRVRGVCQSPECNLPHFAKGLCKKHYVAAKRAQVRPPKPKVSKAGYIEARIIVADSGCWEWQLALNVGYGIASWNGVKQMAHRFSYETLVGPIPDGLHIDHLCRNTRCVNPEHLEPVTPRENVLRGMHPSILAFHSGRCMKGHEMNEANTYVSPKGERHCRSCMRINRAERYARDRAAS